MHKGYFEAIASIVIWYENICDFISDKAQCWDYCGLLSTFKTEGNIKFKLEVSENKDMFSPVQVHKLSEFYPWFAWESMAPKLRTSEGLTFSIPPPKLEFWSPY